MAKQIIWTRKAQLDRKEILEYWREHNHSNTYSIKLNLIIKKAITLIAAHPQIGRRTNVDNVRVKLVREYLIFYEERNKQIFILTIWDSRRNPKIYLSKSKTFLFLSTFPLLGTVFWQLVQNRQNDTRIQLFRYQKISVTICTAKYRFPETICLFTGDNLNRENK